MHVNVQSPVLLVLSSRVVHTNAWLADSWSMCVNQQHAPHTAIQLNLVYMLHSTTYTQASCTDINPGCNGQLEYRIRHAYVKTTVQYAFSHWLQECTCISMSCEGILPLPKTVCLPFSHEVMTVVMKNWEPLVFGPALAMLNNPGMSCFSVKFSS